MKNFTLKGKSLFCLGFLVISMFVSAGAQTFNGPGFTVLDGAGVDFTSCSIVPVSGITNNVTVRSVTLTGLTHSFIGDTFITIYPADVTLDGFLLAGPPDATPCNYGGNYTFSDIGTTSIDLTAAGCTTNQIIPSATYRTSDYGAGTNPGPITSLANDFGSFTPAETNGDWYVCVFDYAGNGQSGSVVSTSITFAGPTAASISISGRVITPTGSPVVNVTLTLTDGNGNVQITRTATNGGYTFENLPAGTIYTVTASGKNFTFNQPTQFFNGTQDFTGADFVAYSIRPVRSFIY